MSDDCLKCLDDVQLTKQEIKELDMDREMVQLQQQQQQNKKKEDKDKAKELLSLLEEL